MNLEMDEEFGFYSVVYYPSRRSDLDNHYKAVLDCLQKVTKTIKNDNKCVEIASQRRLDKENPRIEIVLSFPPIGGMELFDELFDE